MMRQKFKIAMIGLALLLAGCDLEKNKDFSQSELEVRKNASELMEAFNHHEPEKIAALWAKNGVFFHPLTGEISKGKSEIVQYYKDQFAKQKDSKIEIIVDSVEFQGKDQATEKGLFRISFDGKSSVQSAFKANLIKEDGKWVIQEIRDIAIEQAPSQFEHLKEIDWLVGEWVDHDENVEITFSCKWDKYKNFLTQRFTTKILGQHQLEGQQIIAWDPIKEQIRSWVFDSDGGVGEGFWTKKNNSWYVHMSYTLADARRASATLIYTKIDDNSYTFASTGRDIDGEVLPDIDPVKIERKQ